jgi:phage shock protein E
MVDDGVKTYDSKSRHPATSRVVARRENMKKLFAIMLALVAGIAVAGELSPVGGRYLIDVRTEKEWNEGHIDGATLIPHEQIADRIAGVIADKNAPIGLYCRSGRRSGIALEALRGMGYTNVVNLGGFEEASVKVAACKAAPGSC